MNQIYKIDDTYFITINSDRNGNLSKTDIITTTSLSYLEKGAYRSLYKQMGFVGQPYFITCFDDKYWISEISENRGNGIKSFVYEKGQIRDIETLFFWDESIEKIKVKVEYSEEFICRRNCGLIHFYGTIKYVWKR